MPEERTIFQRGSDMKWACPRCKQTFPQIPRCTGESGLYKARHTLCEPCFLEEDDEIEEKGTNNLPERLASYGPPNEGER